jgi:hypothetical protein
MTIRKKKYESKNTAMRYIYESEFVLCAPIFDAADFIGRGNYYFLQKQIPDPKDMPIL